MSKKLLLTVMALTLLLADCSQPGASPTPAPADTPVQVDLLRLAPPEFLSAGYCDMKRIREDPDLKAVFEAVSGGCVLSEIPDNVDAAMAVGVLPSAADSLGITIGIITIYRSNFDREAMAEQPQESDFAGALPQVTPQDYLGVELSVTEDEEGHRFASALIDEATSVFGPEAGVKAVLDTAKGLTTPPLTDLGAALPRVFYAAVMGMCNYEAQGCTAMVFPGLAKGSEGTISTIQLYQFENAEMAADALPAIRTEQEEGGISQFGSVRIVGDTITQEGRFVKVEGTLPVEDLFGMFNFPVEPSFVEAGRNLAMAGDIEGAVAQYQQALELDPSLEISADSWNVLCWFGSLWEHSAEVMDACERAVELAPDDGAIRDSRGLARALTEDYAGAIQDFKYALEWFMGQDMFMYEKYRLEREAWIVELGAGRNPFDAATLEALRNE